MEEQTRMRLGRNEAGSSPARACSAGLARRWLDPRSSARATMFRGGSDGGNGKGRDKGGERHASVVGFDGSRLYRWCDARA
nr:hypothetical protein CFP56_11457 [Quercus suber]